MGNIVTFYSYKGGVGRTMALANIAVLLAQWNYKVLVVDWDLEAPGLEFYFSDFIDTETVSQEKGLIDFLSDVYQRGFSPGEKYDWRNYKLSIPLGTDTAVSIDFMGSGQKTEDYFKKVLGFDIPTFYSQKNGWGFFEYLRDQWKEEYDFILVDARTGITDVAGVCTVQLPDMLMLLFNTTEQSFSGAKEVAIKAYRSQKKLPYDRYRLEIIPVPSRFDGQVEFTISRQWLDRFARELTDIYDNWLPTSITPRRFLDVSKIPYIPYFSFGEKLPVIEQGTDDASGLGYAYENLAALIARNLEHVDRLIEDRDLFINLAAQKTVKEKKNIFISYSYKDEKWKERLLKHLKVLEGTRDIDVWHDGGIQPGSDWSNQITQAISRSSMIILLISANYLSSKYILEGEIPLILERRKLEGTTILPVILEPSAWKQISWLASIQLFPKDGKPLSSGKDYEIDSNLVELVNEIAKILKEKD